HSRRWLASSAAILLSGGAIVWTLDAQEQHRQIRQAWPVLDRDEQANDEDEEREREGQRPRRRWRLRERGGACAGRRVWRAEPQAGRPAHRHTGRRDRGEPRSMSENNHLPKNSRRGFAVESAVSRRIRMVPPNILIRR